MSDPIFHPIVPFTTRSGSISLTLTPSQFDELNRALISYNKRRSVNRSQAAKRRGATSSSPAKPILVFSDITPVYLPYDPSLPVIACPRSTPVSSHP